MQYTDTKLPKNPKWERAFEIGRACLLHSLEADEQDLIDVYYQEQAIDVLKHLQSHSDHVSEDLITVTLLGPMGVLYGLNSKPDLVQQNFGQGVLDLMKDIQDKTSHSTPDMMKQKSADAQRLFLASTAVHIKNNLIPPFERGRLHIASVESFVNAVEKVITAAKQADHKLWLSCHGQLMRMKTILDNQTASKKQQTPPVPKS